MIHRRYFAMFPTVELCRGLSQINAPASLCNAELIVKKLSSRDAEESELKEFDVVNTYSQVFVHQVLVGVPGSESLARRITEEDALIFWKVIVFDSCEDVDDLKADLTLAHNRG